LFPENSAKMTTVHSTTELKRRRRNTFPLLGAATGAGDGADVFGSDIDGQKPNWPGKPLSSGFRDS